MYSFSDSKKLPIIKVVCDCKRQFIQEEFYTCFECQETYCRFCTKQEILEKFCRKCQNKESQTDYNFKTHCSKCFECPFCKNVLSVQLDKQEQSAPQRKKLTYEQLDEQIEKQKEVTKQEEEQLDTQNLIQFPLIPEDNQLQLIKEKSSEKNLQINKYLNTIYDSSDKTLEQELAGFTKANFEFSEYSN
ncbi:hypothetical protein PPERSA_01321 [Pseudocohnilembus persalinus]|uniref:Uncharacterized protein n=1 Tax=Pseudocohnilembus persalinus TaxID=266149 RepID=A0A0V0QH11_PSEPJ|nr:hypothetical protein PPERSA_01321 [Pseudocohnilembus persalinus]|eukprot:KRX01418.1 hypothetical protein PPERSA_01321 [Pseudocohnilembus persalinus]